MKRTPLKRKSPMRRRHRALRALADDVARLEWLHQQPCAVTGKSPVDVHHSTVGRCAGKKNPHSHGIPLGHGVHMDFHANTGYFKGWKKEQLREWQTGQVMRYQALWDLHQQRANQGVSNASEDFPR